jgi:hypothetical protein
MRCLLLFNLLITTVGAPCYADEGSTLLARAAYEGTREIVAHLIAEGVDVNAENPQGGTALFLAAEQGHIGIVRLLLEHGADANKIPRPNPSTGVVSMTPLMAAAAHGETAVVELLMACGADASTQVGKTALHEHGVTALFLATIKGHAQVVDLLTRAATSGEGSWKYMVIAIWIFFGSFLISLWNGQDGNRGMKNP